MSSEGSLDQLEQATPASVDWFNNPRLLSLFGNVPAAAVAIS
jgi:hypothetical protein